MRPARSSVPEITRTRNEGLGFFTAGHHIACQHLARRGRLHGLSRGCQVYGLEAAEPRFAHDSGQRPSSSHIRACRGGPARAAGFDRHGLPLEPWPPPGQRQTSCSSSNTKENLTFWIDEGSKRVSSLCLSSGLMTAGSALLAAACLMSLIEKVGI